MNVDAAGVEIEEESKASLSDDQSSLDEAIKEAYLTIVLKMFHKVLTSKTKKISKAKNEAIANSDDELEDNRDDI